MLAKLNQSELDAIHKALDYCVGNPNSRIGDPIARNDIENIYQALGSPFHISRGEIQALSRTLSGGKKTAIHGAQNMGHMVGIASGSRSTAVQQIRALVRGTLSCVQQLDNPDQVVSLLAPELSEVMQRCIRNYAQCVHLRIFYGHEYRKIGTLARLYHAGLSAIEHMNFVARVNLMYSKEYCDTAAANTCELKTAIDVTTRFIARVEERARSQSPQNERWYPIPEHA